MKPGFLLNRQAVIFLMIAVCLGFAPLAIGKTEGTYQERRAKALALDEQHSPDAEKALKALLADNPKDHIVNIKYAYCLYNRAQALPEGRKRKALIKEARAYLIRAKNPHVEEPLIDLMLNSTTEDGSEIKRSFAQNKSVNELIKQAEKAYSAHDFAKARDFYQQALQVEPTNYPATLFIGDAYFAEGKLDQSIEWFTKAAALNPSIETAFRYCGDALAKLGRNDEALEQYVDAVVAEPYNRLPRHALTRFAQTRGLAARFKASPLPVADVMVDGKNVKLGVGENGGILTMAYAIFRAGMITKHQETASKDTPKYRQTLAEEKEVLELLMADYFEMKQNKPEDDREIALYATAFNELKQIADAGLIEPHILFTRANAEIAMDYDEFRSQHRDQVITYLKRCYLGLN